MINRIKKLTSKPVNKTRKFIENKPLISFIALLALVFGIILLGSFLDKTEEETITAEVQPTPVEVFSIGSAPKVSVPAQIDKSGVIRIIAQTSGIVQDVKVSEGQYIKKGSNIAWISTNYRGGTAETVQRQISGANYYFQKETRDEEKRLIELRREQAHENFEDKEKLREIAVKSEERTEEQIELTSEILNEIEEQIKDLEANNSGGTNDAQILQLKQTRLQLISSNNQLKNSLAQSEYSTGSELESGQSNQENLEEISRDITLAQLDMEEKSNELALETARLNYQLSKIREALNYPSTPISGMVERVFVNKGDSVNPGDTIAIITGNDNSATAVALVSSQIAQKVSVIEESTLIKNGTFISIFPAYVSSEPTEGNLHSIIFNIPEEDSAKFVNDEFITAEIPIGTSDSISTFPFIPVETVYQTQDSAYVYVANYNAESNNYVASIREIGLGQVYGSYVEVESGLDNTDQIIINRNIVENETVALSGI